MRYENLPTKEQIGAITDVAALEEIRSDIERSILHIEAQLEFSSNESAAWEKSAQNALAMHRLTDRQIAGRLAHLQAEKQREEAVRPDDACSPLTLLMMKNRPDIRAERYETLKDVDAAMDWLVERLNAVADDREDEISQGAGNRDEGFLAATGSLLRLMRGQRMALQNRRGELAREAKKAEQLARDAIRERLFIEAARTLLDRDTFLSIWTAVDRLEARP